MSKLIRMHWKESSFKDVNEYINKCYSESDSKCPVDKLKKFTEITKCSSCGECVICREGIWQMHAILDSIVNSLGKNEDIEIIDEISKDLTTESCCNYGKEVGKVTQEILKENIEQFEKHIKRKICNEGICEKLKSSNVVAPKSGGLMSGRRRKRS